MRSPRFQSLQSPFYRTALLAVALAGCAQGAITFTTPATLPAGVVGQFYGTVVNVTGGTAPLRWAWAGTIPAGLTLNSTNGFISGTPTAGGTFTFAVQVTDASQVSVSSNFSLIISTPVSITSAPTLPNGVVGKNYSHQFTASGGTLPLRWSTTGGLPPGL